MTDRYDWDPIKASENLRNHGISFADAAEALADPDGVPVYDQEHSLHEERFHWIGLSSKGILLVVFTDRYGDLVCRIISARRATRKERAVYYEKKRED